MAIIGCRSFTRQYGGIAHEIKTECLVSRAYIPQKTHASQVPKLTKWFAIWDTGATNTVISKPLAEKLGLIPVSFAKTYHARGSDDVPVYFINIVLPNNIQFYTLKVSEGILLDADILIGMDIIGCGDFCLSHKEGRTKFTFQIPSTHDFDFTEEKDEPIIVEKKQSRNEKCNCGSGKRYKDCCLKKN